MIISQIYKKIYSCKNLRQVEDILHIWNWKIIQKHFLYNFLNITTLLLLTYDWDPFVYKETLAIDENSANRR